MVRRAAELFDEVGYGETRMEEIAAAADIRKATLYHYFNGKEQLLLLIHEQFMELLMSRVEARAETAANPTEFLRGVVEDIVKTVHDYPHHVRVFFEHYRQLPEPERSALRVTRDRYAKLVEQAIENGMRTGEFRKMDPRLAMFAFFGVVNWTYTWYRPDGELSMSELSDFIWEFARRGLT